MEEQSLKDRDCLGTEHDDLARYLAKAAATRTPLFASFELTRRCSFRCVHCYLGDQEAIRTYQHRELDTTTIIRLLDEMVEAGTLFLTLTGGDPMLRPDFIRIYEHAVRTGLLVSVYCNGALITEEIASSFSRYPPRIVEVTLYGATRKTFENITQRPGSFAACMEGIERLRQTDVRLRLKTMAMTLNHEELPAMRKLAEDIEVQFRHDCSIIPALPNEDNSGCTNIRSGEQNNLRATLRFRLAPEQAAYVDFGTADVKEKLRELTIQETAPTELSKELYHCGAGRSSYHITPYGRMQPCIITLEPAVDLITGRQSFSESWNTMNREFTQQKAGAGFSCNRCKNKMLCAGCPSGFAVESGSPENIPFFYCRYAQCLRQGNSVRHPIS
jgi:radical SAM protein with 4Fe4S-binding SPASM domain